jgi:hypothetical protein
MLVQAPNGQTIFLFPAWDLAQDASFSGLLVKGAVEVSASWSAAKKAVSGVAIVARKERKTPVVIETTGLGVSFTSVSCADGTKPVISTTGTEVSFVAPAGVRCAVE